MKHCTASTEILMCVFAAQNSLWGWCKPVTCLHVMAGNMQLQGRENENLSRQIVTMNHRSSYYNLDLSVRPSVTYLLRRFRTDCDKTRQIIL